MTDNLKTAFGNIRADDKLKADTLVYLHSEMQRHVRTHTRQNPVKRIAVTFASIAIILLAGVFSYNLYFTPSAYVDVDVNPSVELTLNRFDRVIGARAYNVDGENVLSGLSLNYKNYEDALIALIDAINREGYIQDGGLVSVTLQTDNAGQEAELLANIQTGVTDYIAGHHNSAQVDVFPVSGDTRSCAQEQGLSPAKYLAIEELMAVDPTVTVEGCRGHSISEIKEQTQAYMGGHHGNGDTDNNNGNGHHGGGHG